MKDHRYHDGCLMLGNFFIFEFYFSKKMKHIGFILEIVVAAMVIYMYMHKEEKPIDKDKSTDGLGVYLYMTFLNTIIPMVSNYWTLLMIFVPYISSRIIIDHSDIESIKKMVYKSSTQVNGKPGGLIIGYLYIGYISARKITLFSSKKTYERLIYREQSNTSKKENEINIIK